MFDLLRKLINFGSPAQVPVINADTNTSEEELPRSLELARRGTNNKVDHANVLTLLSSYTKAVDTRKAFIDQFDKLKDYYLVEAIFSLISEDSLTPDISSNEILNVYSENEAVNAELQKLQETINFDLLVDDIIYDLLGYGEYTLRMEILEGMGVTEIVDDVEQYEMVAFYKDHLPYAFMNKNKKGTAVISHPHEYVHFSLGNKKIRIKINDEYKSRFSDENLKQVMPEGLPTYVRVGRPVLYGVLSKIKELQLLESLIPASKLEEITKGNLVGISVPPGTPPKEALELTKTYQDILNERVGVDTTDGYISISDILNQAGNIKILPIFGDKGDLRSLDVGERRSVDDLVNSASEYRSLILSSIGIPPSAIYGGEGPKSEILKQYSRYLRKLKSVQHAIKNGISQICVAHCSNIEKPIKITSKHIIVDFKNELVNIDELDKLEFMTAIVDTLERLNNFVLGLQSSDDLKDMVNIDDYKKYAKQFLQIISSGEDFITDGDGDDADQDVDFPDSGFANDQF